MSKVKTHERPLMAGDVARIREKLGLSPLQLAALLSTTRRNVYRWEDGETVPPLVTTILHMLDERPDILGFMRECGEGN